MTKHEFSAPIEQARGGGAFVVVPFDVEQTFGKKRVPVNATIDGVPYRGSLFPYMGASGLARGVYLSQQETAGRSARCSPTLSRTS